MPSKQAEVIRGLKVTPKYWQYELQTTTESPSTSGSRCHHELPCNILKSVVLAMVSLHYLQWKLKSLHKHYCLAAFGGCPNKCLPSLYSSWQLCTRAPANPSLSNMYLVKPSDPSKASLRRSGTLRDTLTMLSVVLLPHTSHLSRLTPCISWTVRQRGIGYVRRRQHPVPACRICPNSHLRALRSC